MALDPVPWFIGGGAEHSADVARLVVHIATGGAAGIVGANDLFVSQMPAPIGSVRVSAGAAVIPNTNAVQQAYCLRAPSVTDIAVTATGSTGGRSDLLVAYVDDPQFTGQVLPVDKVALGPYVKFTLIQGVGPTQATVPASFTYPAIPLARITLPANTAAVTQAMITDLRVVAQPNRTRDLYNTRPTSSSVVTSSAYVGWTPQADRAITIPSWASQVKITGHVGQVLARNAALVGKAKATFGSLGTQETAFDMAANTRQTLLVSDTLAVPAALRGTTQTLALKALRLTGTGNLETDAYSTILWDIEFLQVASAD